MLTLESTRGRRRAGAAGLAAGFRELAILRRGRIKPHGAAREAPFARRQRPPVGGLLHPGSAGLVGGQALYGCWAKLFPIYNDNSGCAGTGTAGRPDSVGPAAGLGAILFVRRGAVEMAQLFHTDVHSVSLHRLSMLGGIVTQPQHFVLQLLTGAATPATLRIIRPPGRLGPAGPGQRLFFRRGERLEPHSREGNRARPGRHQVRGDGGVRSGDCVRLAPGEQRVLIDRRQLWRGAFSGGRLTISDRAGDEPAPVTGAMTR